MIAEQAHGLRGEIGHGAARRRIADSSKIECSSVLRFQLSPTSTRMAPVLFCA